MTIFIATTTVSVQRGTGVDSFGDPIDNATVVASGVPVAIVEDSQRKWLPNEQRETLIEQYTIRARPNVDIVENDRLVDEREGFVYQVRDVIRQQAVFGVADCRVTAVRVGSVSESVND